MTVYQRIGIHQSVCTLFVTAACLAIAENKCVVDITCLKKAFEFDAVNGLPAHDESQLEKLTWGDDFLLLISFLEVVKGQLLITLDVNLLKEFLDVDLSRKRDKLSFLMALVTKPPTIPKRVTDNIVRKFRHRVLQQMSGFFLTPRSVYYFYKSQVEGKESEDT